MTVGYKTREKFAEQLVKKIETRISGNGIDRAIGDRPSLTYFVGTLSHHSTDTKRSYADIFTKMSPSKLGVEILVAKNDISSSILRIKPKGAFYYRVFPEWDELEIPDTKQVELDDEEESTDEEEQQSTLKTVFKKIPIPEIIIEKKISELVQEENHGTGILYDSSSVILKMLEMIKRDDKSYLKHSKNKTPSANSVLANALESKEDYYKFLKKIQGNELIPDWKFEIQYRLIDFDDNNVLIAIGLANLSQKRPTNYIDNTIFEAGLELEIEGGNFEPFEIDSLKDDYKYDRKISGQGINCSVTKISDNKIKTENLPIFIQKKHKSSEEFKAEFSDLVDRPKDVLRKLEKLMKATLEDYQEQFKTKSKELTEIGRDEYRRDIEQFKKELERFSRGVGVIDRYPEVGRAFKLMNKTFKNPSRAKEYSSWYLFQIVFIVMNIPDIASRQFPEIESDVEQVEVVYFPTSGGKTEAYLGLVVFAMFFDRIRGKFDGVTALTKFPLRLLSLQQIQRIANIFAQAEIIRRKEKDISSGKNRPFSTGYYVGDRNTPNKLMNGWDNTDLLKPIEEDMEEGRKYQIVSECPFCGKKSVRVVADREKVRLKHICENPECPENVLPIYVSDVEIYRYLPTFIISTIDKMSICGLQRNFRNIFGQVYQECPDHGYTSSPVCVERTYKNCDRGKEEYRPVSLYDPTPSLMIQDELHLIRESLGSFAAHYETFIDYLQQRLTDGKRRMKIIAATATISDYRNQTDHLYMRRAQKFPAPGPSLDRSFYAYTDENEVNRLIVGIMPHNKTHIFCVVDVLQYHQEIIQDYYNQPASLISELNRPDLKTDDDVKSLLSDYSVMLQYNLAKKEGDAVNRSINTQINPNLTKKGLNEITVHSLTGDVSFTEVRDVLEQLEAEWERPPIDLITATNMISHGVDIDKLNFMVFRGMPRNNAEYIQALSRIGRKYPGIVFMIFNPTRERDHSYFKYFEKFHQFKDMLVEAVPLNRWAKFSIDRTVAGIFSGTILNYYDLKNQSKPDQKIYMTNGFQAAVSQGIISEKEIVKFILDSYGVDKDPMGFHFKKEIVKMVQQFFFDLMGHRGRSEYLTGVMSRKPMRSLRDIDEQIPIRPEGDSMILMRGMV